MILHWEEIVGEKTFDVSGAARLDAPERARWMPVGLALEMLALAPGEHVADIGAGSGYFALPFARAVGPDGLVFAVDLQPGMLEILRGKVAQADAPSNIEMRQGTASDTGLAAASCDVVWFANVWHELDDAPAVIQEIKRILKPSGRVAILDWRPDAQFPPGPPSDHRLAPASVVEALRQAGWSKVDSRTFAEYHYLVVAL